MGSLDYIDDYFSGKPAPEEIRHFEKRLTEDEAFAKEVAFYLNARYAAKAEALEEKKRRFAALYREGGKRYIKDSRRVWRYVAAAAVICGILFTWYQLVQPPPAQKLAEQYIRENFLNLDITMSSARDSLQKGLQLFNEGRLTEALRRFESVTAIDTSGFIAIRYAGITSLRLEQYDKALRYFTRLSAYRGLHANPGKLYQAITYLKRNMPGDVQLAKGLLREIAGSDLEGNDTAAKWLKKL